MRQNEAKFPRLSYTYVAEPTENVSQACIGEKKPKNTKILLSLRTLNTNWRHTS